MQQYGESGQATVEFVALIPMLVGVALIVLALLTGHAAREAADQAAIAAAVASLQGTDAKDAAKQAVPGWARTQIHVADGAATVRVWPDVPRLVARAIDAQRTVVFEPRPGR